MPISCTLIERRIAERVKLARIRRDISQSMLSQKIGTSPQRVQQYETGKNKILVSELYIISHALNVNIGSFFDNETVQQGIETSVDNDELRQRDAQIARSGDLKALRLTSLINDDHIRLKLIALLEAIVATTGHVASAAST